LKIPLSFRLSPIYGTINKIRKTKMTKKLPLKKDRFIELMKVNNFTVESMAEYTSRHPATIKKWCENPDNVPDSLIRFLKRDGYEVSSFYKKDRKR